MPDKIKLCNLIKETINSVKGGSATTPEIKQEEIKNNKSQDKTKTIQELDREKLEKKFSKKEKKKLN